MIDVLDGAYPGCSSETLVRCNDDWEELQHSLYTLPRSPTNTPYNGADLISGEPRVVAEVDAWLFKIS
jgi:hypothetical protein